MKRAGLKVILCALLIMSIIFPPIYLYESADAGYSSGSNLNKNGALTDFTACNLKDWNIEKYLIKNKIDKLLGEKPESKVALDARILSNEDMGKYIRREISYFVDKDEKVTAFLLIPKNLKKPMPAVLALHQTIKDGKYEVAGITNNKEMSYGVDLAELGFVVFIPDALSAGDRIFEGQIEYESKPFYEKYPNWSMIGKAIWDNQIAIDYLYTLDIVDKNNIMVMGHSEGAIDSLFLGAFDERVSAVALNCGLSTINNDPDPYRWCRDSWFIGIPSLREYFDRGEIPFDFHEVVALIAPRSFLSLSASEDKFFPHYQGVFDIGKKVSKIYKLYNKKENFSIQVFSGEHSFPDTNKVLIYNWLKKQIR